MKKFNITYTQNCEVEIEAESALEAIEKWLEGKRKGRWEKQRMFDASLEDIEDRTDKDGYYLVTGRDRFSFSDTTKVLYCKHEDGIADGIKVFPNPSDTVETNS